MWGRAPRKVVQLTRAFRHRNYQLFFGGQLISLTGTWMQTVAEAWLVYRLTGSSALLGIAAFCAQIPVFLFATIGGTVADRHDRHRIIVVTQSVSMLMPLVLGVLTLTGLVRVWHVFVLAACLGVVNAFDIPARQAFVVDMVGREDLINAIALNSSMFNGARVVGPAIAGLLVATIGEGWCFLLNGVSYLAVIAGLVMMRVPARAARPASGQSAAREMAEGFRFVARTGPIRALLLLLGVVSFAGLPYARADAGVRRADPARRRERPRHPDGRVRLRRAVRRADPGRPLRRPRAGPLGRHGGRLVRHRARLLLGLPRRSGSRCSCSSRSASR